VDWHSASNHLGASAREQNEMPKMESQPTSCLCPRVIPELYGVRFMVVVGELTSRMV
jgi:hypothetical protein